jgi:hypothetical protein
MFAAMFGAIAKVADIFTLIAFVIAALAYSYNIKLSHNLSKEKQRLDLIKSVPQKDRLSLVISELESRQKTVARSILPFATIFIIVGAGSLIIKTGIPFLWSPKGETDVVPAQPAPASILETQGVVERNLVPREGRWIEAALCLLPEPEGEPVVFNDDVRHAIQLFRTSPGNMNNLGPQAGLTPHEAQELVVFGQHGGCDRNVYANAFEVFTFPTKEDVFNLQQGLATKLPAGIQMPTNGTFDHRTRDAIKAIQRGYCMPETGELTRPFIDRLVDPPPAACPDQAP